MVTRTSLRIHPPWSHPTRKRIRCRLPASSARLERDSVGIGGELCVGIDLGTTNSAVSVFQDGKARIIPDANGNRIIPSVVSYLPNGEILVGNEAKNRMGTDPRNTFYSVKRLIGLTYEEVQPFEADFPFRLSSDEEGAVLLLCDNVPDGVLYPEETSGEILRHLCSVAEAHVGGFSQVTKAVVTVPAYFNEEQREATKTAALVAGIEHVRLLREPISAALAYGLKLEEDETILVFDFGGGTFDVSILEVGGGAVEVLATSGDSHLGGDDFDLAIASWIESHLVQAGQSVVRDSETFDNVLKKARQAREELTTTTHTTISLPMFSNDGSALEIDLSRERLESLCADILKRCALPMQQACWQAGIDLELMQAPIKSGSKKQKERAIRPVDHVLLVGGPTRMPMIQKFVENMTGVKPKVRINPDEAVARGAAVQAAILSGLVDDFLVMDVWQAALMRALARAKQREDRSNENK